MKIFTIIVLAFGLLLSAKAQENFGTPPVSKISTELIKKELIHSVECWQLESTKGNNNIEMVIEAIKYSTQNSTDILKGIKITLLPDDGLSDEKIAKTSKQFEAYIDVEEYSDILVVLNQMLKNFEKKDKDETRGYIEYTTLSNIKFGFTYTKKKEIGFLSIIYSQAEISCEFSDIEDFLSELRGYIDIAAKELYLPENAEKLKNVKKSDQKAKDVIIDDI